MDEATLQTRLNDLIAEHNVPGAAVAVYRDDTLVEAAAGIANLNTGVEVTRDTLFQIGSITKVYTATLVMQLVDEGKVDLDAPIGTYITDLRLADAEAAATITIRQLLCHTAGLEGDYFGTFGYGDEGVAKYVASLADLPQLHEPGLLFSYCNTGWVLLGRLVEVLTDQPYTAALQSRLLEPAGLTLTAARTEDAILRRVAVGHLPDPSSGEPVVAPMWSLDPASAPAGSLTCAAARDLIGFARIHLDDGRAPNGKQVLAPASVKAMQERQVELLPHGAREAWGLGWSLMSWGDARLIGHDGGTVGQLAFLLVVPDRRFAAAVVTNGMNGSAVSRALFSEIFAGIGIEMPGDPVPGGGRPEDLDRYTGTYVRHGVRVEVEESDGGLVVGMRFEGPMATLAPEISGQKLPYLEGDAFLLSMMGQKAPAVFADFGDDGRARWLHIGARAHRRT